MKLQALDTDSLRTMEERDSVANVVTLFQISLRPTEDARRACNNRLGSLVPSLSGRHSEEAERNASRTL